MATINFRIEAPIANMGLDYQSLKTGWYGLSRISFGMLNRFKVCRSA